MKDKSNSHYNHNTKFRAKEDTRIFVLARERRTVFLVDLNRGQLFQLRRGQTFYEGKPIALRESLW